MKKFLSLLIVLSLLLLAISMASAQEAAVAPVRVASLKGPTSMGMVKLMKDDETAKQYQFTVAGTADEIVPLLAKGELDIALIPGNLASVLYNKTSGALQVAAVNTLGVLYVVEQGESVQSIADLKGQTLYSTGKGTTPEFALNHILAKNGIDPEKDLTIEFKTEATEVAAALGAGTVSLAVLPQPFVTAAQAQNPQLRVALSLTDEWNAVDPDSAMLTGVVVVRRAFAEENPQALSEFMTAYEQSTVFVNENPEEAGVWIEELGIAKAAVAAKAIPACNIVCITGEEMKNDVSGYLNALYEQNPAAVGGTLPDEDFYYIP